MERVPQLVRRGKKDRRMGAPSELDWEAIEALRTEMRVAAESRENQRPRLPEGMPPSSDEKLGRSSGALVMANRIRKFRKWSR